MCAQADKPRHITTRTAEYKRVIEHMLVLCPCASTRRLQTTWDDGIRGCLGKYVVVLYVVINVSTGNSGASRPQANFPS
jgi:hypothetical protein